MKLAIGKQEDIVGPIALTWVQELTSIHIKDMNNQFVCLFYWGFTPFSTLFQLYHGDNKLMRDPWVNKHEESKKNLTAGLGRNIFKFLHYYIEKNIKSASIK